MYPNLLNNMCATTKAFNNCLFFFGLLLINYYLVKEEGILILSYDNRNILLKNDYLSS